MTKSIDSDVEYFNFRSTLTIDPPLPDTKVASFSNGFLKLKQTRDEDVQIVDGEIKVISKHVTEVEAQVTPGDMQYSGYADVKAGVKGAAKIAKEAGSVLSGYIFVHTSDNRFFRLNVVNNVVKIEGALLAWPDGTTSPFPGEGTA